ncbi:phage-related protein [Orbus hercynius]|uniref:Phage-related protein n=1 Tax=Orbus hercynius TaxID=593135 RepID=A0A495RI16_9GAMM|nr:hypothetical protein [Orbus hercynius]RKS86914.1 phage-related protein [Orbus hercynius]
MKLDQALITIGVESTQVQTINTLVSGINNTANELRSSTTLINNSLSATFMSLSATMEKTGEKTEKTTSLLQQLKQGVISVAKVVNQAAKAFDESIRQTESLAKNKDALFKISQDEVAVSKAYTKALDKSQTAISSVKNKIALGLAPTVIKLIGYFNDWLLINKNLIQNGISNLVTILSKVIQTFMNTARFIDAIISNTVGWQNALIILGSVWAHFNRQLLLSPLGVVAAAIIGLMLIIDDFMVYMDGGDSLFGNFWGVCVEWISKLKPLWNSLSDEMKNGLGNILALLAVLATATSFISVIRSSKTFISVIKSLSGTLSFLTKITGLLSKAVIFLGRAFLMNPIGLIVTLVAALVYALFDLYQWVTTGESTFGSFWQMFVDGWNYVKALFFAVVDWIVAKWNGFVESCKAICQTIIDVFDQIVTAIISAFTTAYDWVMGIFDEWGQAIASFVDNIISVFAAIGQAIIKPFADAIAWVKEKFIGGIESAVKKVKGFLSFFGVGDKSSDDNQDIAKAFSTEQMSNAARQATIAKTSNTTNTVNQGDVTNNITIHSSDTRTSAREAAELYQTHLVDARNNLNSSVGAA